MSNIKSKISENFALSKKHPFAFYFIISWLIINWKVVLFLLFDPVKSQAKIQLIKSLFIPEGFCQTKAFSFICWFSSDWNPDNKLLTFDIGLPILVAFIVVFIINPYLASWFYEKEQRTAKERIGIRQKDVNRILKESWIEDFVSDYEEITFENFRDSSDDSDTMKIIHKTLSTNEERFKIYLRNNLINNSLFSNLALEVYKQYWQKENNK